MESLAFVFRGGVGGFCLCVAVLRRAAYEEDRGNGGNEGEEAARGEDEE